MNTLKNAPAAHPGNQSKACSKCFISSRRSSLYVSESCHHRHHERRAPFQGSHNTLCLRPITLPFTHKRSPDTKPSCQPPVDVGLQTKRHIAHCAGFPCVNNSMLTPGHESKGITASSSILQPSITM